MFKFSVSDPDEKPNILSRLTFTTWRSDSPKPESNQNPNRPHSRAWIKGVVICSWIIASILSLNILLTIIAAGIAYTKYDDQNFSFASLYTGKCSVAKNWTTGLHLVINILSTVLLGASNYCMQCLASPSRAQVDEAHSKRIWMRVGMPNIWNLLRRQRGKRQLLGWILLATSLPIHLIYNSAIFFAFGPTQYSIVAAQKPIGTMQGNGSADFQECFEEVVKIDMAALNAEMGRSDLERLSNEECINTFAQDYVSGQRLIVLVTDEPMPKDEPVVLLGSGNSVASSFKSKGSSSFSWMCGGDYECTKSMANEMVTGDIWNVQPLRWSIPSLHLELPTGNGFHNISGELFINPGTGVPDTPDTRRLKEILEQDPYEDQLQAQLDDPSNWVNASFPGNVTIFGHQAMCGIEQQVPVKLPKTYPIQQCLTVPVEETCQLVFSPVIALIVIGCNLVKLICSLLTARDSREDLFLTTGDAIASYLERPDPTTKGSCLLSNPLIAKGAQGWRKKPKKPKKRQPLELEVEAKLPLELPARKRWLHAVSRGRWIFTITLFVCMLIPAIYVLRLGILDYYRAYGSPSIWDSGLGEVTSATVLTGITVEANSDGIFFMIFLANVPQLFVSVAYFTLNALLTIMLGAVEYDTYARDRKPLRVSWPRGAQRSTYYLSLPYRYSFPLLIISAVLHWLVSQSLFFVEIIPFDIDGMRRFGAEVVTCGYSPVAIIFAIVVSGSLFIASMLLGLRRFKSSMPLAAQCSAAISAACHPTTTSSNDDANHALKPVQWGEVPVVYSSASPITFSNRISGDMDADVSRRESGSDERRQMLPSTGLNNDSNSFGAVELGAHHCTFSSEDLCEPSWGRIYI